MASGDKQKVKKFRIGRLFYNNQFVLAFSVLLSFILWFVIVYAVNPQTASVYRDVKVLIELNKVEVGKGLVIVRQEAILSEVTLTGGRVALSALKQDDIIVNADATMIKADGAEVDGKTEVTLSYRFTLPSGVQATRYTPDKVTVVFDREETKEISVSVDTTRLKVAPGIVFSPPQPSQSVVNVTGYASVLNQITKASVILTSEQTIGNSTDFLDQPIRLLNRDDVEVVGQLTANPVKTDVYLPVQKEKEVPLTVTFSNLPEGQSSPPYQVSPQRIRIRGPVETINQTEEIVLKVDYNVFSDKKYTCTIDGYLRMGVVNAGTVKEAVIQIS